MVVRDAASQMIWVLGHTLLAKLRYDVIKFMLHNTTSLKFC